MTGIPTNTDELVIAMGGDSYGGPYLSGPTGGYTSLLGTSAARDIFAAYLINTADNPTGTAWAISPNHVAGVIVSFPSSGG